jgi:acetyl esterase
MPAEPLDLAYAAALSRIEATGLKAGDPSTTPLHEARAQQDRYFAFLNQEPPEGLIIRSLSIPGPHGEIPLRVYRRMDAPSGALPTLVFVRGSGWWAGGLDSHDRVMRLGALHSGCTVVGLDYRRTPEHREPVQVQELLATLQWLRVEGRHHGADRRRVALWGESAGATIALVAAMRLRDEGAPLPQALLLYYGNFEGPKANLRPQSRWYWQQYLGSDTLEPDPSAVPARQSVEGLPPTWLGVGDLDPLLVDTIAMHQRMAAAGVRCTLQRYPGLPHAFMNLTRLFPGAVKALDDSMRFACEALGVERPASLDAVAGQPPA